MIRGRYTEQTHAVVVLFGAMLSILYGNIAFLLFAGIVGFCWMIVSDAGLSIRDGRAFGLANWITLIRLSAILVALGSSEWVGKEIILALFLLSIALDWLDGYVAKSRGETSVFGARFDMETDAFFAAAASFIIVMELNYPPAILFAGLLRYYFVLVKRIFHLHNLPAPSMPGVRFLAVVFFISLLTPFILPYEIAVWLVSAGAAVVIYSFGRELYLLVKLSK